MLIMYTSKGPAIPVQDTGGGFLLLGPEGHVTVTHLAHLDGVSYEYLPLTSADALVFLAYLEYLGLDGIEGLKKIHDDITRYLYGN